MPAVSVCDPVAAAIRQSLDIGQIKSAADDISISLTSGASKILQSEIKYESTDDYQTKLLDNLKTKYTVLSLPSINEQKNQMDNGKMKDNNNILRKKSDNKNNKNSPLLPEPIVTLYSSDKVQLGWKGIFPVGAGMYNVGNTCYLNSTLQALFHVPSLVNWLLSDTHHNSKCEQNGGGGGECLTCAMSKTLQFSHEKSGNAIKPFYIYNKLRLICRTMVPGQQEDAHEFLRYLLEGMERAYLNRHKASKLDSYSKETTPINQIFGGYIRTEVRCLYCRHVSTTFSHFQDLLVDIRKASTLDEALSNYFSREQLDNNDYKCEACKRRVPATKQFSLEKPPKVLCVQLKRFSVLGGKISRHIGFKQTIDMGQYLWRENNEQQRKLNYKLMSIVTHMGPSVNCGHYTAVAQVSTGQYYSFDDSSVRSINFSNVMNTNPYIMIFEMESSSLNQLPTNQPTKLNTINNIKTITTTNGNNLLKSLSPKPSTSTGIITTTTTTTTTTAAAAAATTKNGHTNGNSKSRNLDMPFIGPQLPSSSSSKIQLKTTNFIGPQLPPQKTTDKTQTKVVMQIKNSKILNGNSLVPYDGSSDEDDNTTTVKNINNNSSNNKLPVNNNNNSNNNNNNKNGIIKTSTKDVIKSEISKASTKSTNLPQKSIVSLQNTINGNDNIKNGNDKIIVDTQQQKQNGKSEIKTETNGKEKLQQSIKIKTYPDDRVITKAASSINGWEVSKDVPSPTSAATPNGWSVTDNKEDNKKLNHTTNSSSSPSVPSAAAPRSFNGTNRSETVSHLLKMSNRGYGNPSVTNWNGTRTHLDREVDNERREERKRHYDEDDDELDRGRCKKIKNHRDYDSGRSNPGYNPFQEYQNGKSWGRSNSGSYHRRNGNSYYNTSSHGRARHGGGNNNNNNNNHRNNYRHHNNHSSRDHWQRR